jgi:serine protease
MRRWLLPILFCLSLLFFLTLGWLVVTLTGLTTQGSFNSVVIDFREDVGKGRIVEFLDRWAENEKVRPRLNSEFSEVDQIYVVEGDQSTLRKLRLSAGFSLAEYIEPNYLYGLPEATQSQFPVNPGKDVPKKSNSVIPNDPLYPQQWNLHSIGAETAWAATRGKDVTVAIIDTGIAKVPDLNDERFVDGYDFINDETNASDDQGHGTHIAGTIAQNTNNGYGAAGIASEVRLMPLKVVTVGGTATAADIAEAIRLAADNGADVINLSLAGSGYSRLMQQSIDYAYRKGLTIVAAAGNSNQNAVSYPARYHHVLAVSALDIGAKRAFYSNFGAGVDISAPGGWVTSEKPMGGIVQNTFDIKTKEAMFAPYQGSSFAAAHVSGSVALLKSLQKLEPDQIEAVLAASSRKVASDPLNELGSGQLDLGAAVKLVQAKQIPQLSFLRWVNNQGYLGSYLWVDPDSVADGKRVWMLLGALGLALLWRLKYAIRWNGWLLLGLVLSSSGLFFLQGLHFYGAPHWLFRLFGSALPEVGTVAQGVSALDPISTSVLLPGALWLLLYRLERPRWFAIGVAIGMVPGLLGYIWPAPEILNVAMGLGAQIFLGVNALLTFLLSGLMLTIATRKPKKKAPQSTDRPSKVTSLETVRLAKAARRLQEASHQADALPSAIVEPPPSTESTSVKTADDADPTAST